MKDWKLITLDFDNRNDPNIIKAFKSLKKSQIRLSSSGKGYHVRGWAYCDNTIEVRKKLGDDTERISFDEQVKERPKGILWDEKTVNGKKMYAGEWIKFISRESDRLLKQKFKGNYLN